MEAALTAATEPPPTDVRLMSADTPGELGDTSTIDPLAAGRLVLWLGPLCAIAAIKPTVMPVSALLWLDA